MELEESRKRLERQGLRVAVVTYDSPAVLRHFAERRQIRYPLLSDEGSAVIRRLGILNTEVPADSPAAGIPHPMTFVLDESGKVTARYRETDYRQRRTMGAILVRQFGAAGDGQPGEVRAKHLTVRTSASNAVARSGQRVALVAEVVLPPRMHVYAPTVTGGYIPVNWKLEESPAWVSQPVEYPQAETLHLPAIQETVPVYQGKVRFVREVLLGSTAKVQPLLDATGHLTLGGSLRYQACDDKVCYVPETVPLTWRIRFEADDRQRVPAEMQRKPAGAQR